MISIFNGSRRQLGGNVASIFVQLDVTFRQHLRSFPDSSLSVFLCIALHANQDGWAWPSVETICEETGLERKTVQRALRQLCGDDELAPVTVPVAGTAQRVLLRSRRRAGAARYTSNAYLIFPSAEDIAEHESPRSVQRTSVQRTSVERTTKDNHDSEEYDHDADASQAGNVARDEDEQHEVTVSTEGNVGSDTQAGNVASPKPARAPRPGTLALQAAEAVVKSHGISLSARQHSARVVTRLEELGVTAEEAAAAIEWLIHERWGSAGFYPITRLPDDVESWRGWQARRQQNRPSPERPADITEEEASLFM